MKKKLLIIGSGDLGQQLAHIAYLQDYYEFVGFVDDFKPTDTKVGAHTILGKVADLTTLFNKGVFNVFSIGIGYNHMEQRGLLFESLVKKFPAATLIHPQSNIDPKAIIKPGSVIYIGVTIDANTIIEENVLLNAGAVIAHDTTIGSHTFVSPGVHLAGFITIGKQCIIGIGSTVIDNIAICDEVRIGAGAVVVKNITKPGVYKGIPAQYSRPI